MVTRYVSLVTNLISGLPIEGALVQDKWNQVKWNQMKSIDFTWFHLISLDFVHVILALSGWNCAFRPLKLCYRSESADSLKQLATAVKTTGALLPVDIGIHPLIKDLLSKYFLLRNSTTMVTGGSWGFSKLVDRWMDAFGGLYLSGFLWQYYVCQQIKCPDQQLSSRRLRWIQELVWLQKENLHTAFIWRNTRVFCRNSSRLPNFNPSTFLRTDTKIHEIS